MQKDFNIKSKITAIILSVIFAVVNVAFFVFMTNHTAFFDLRYIISSLILFCIYIFSTVVFKIKTAFTLEKILFIQLGGIFTFIAAVAMPIYFIISYILDFGVSGIGWAILTAVTVAEFYVIAVILPLGLNLMIFYVYGLFAAAKKRRKIN